MSARLVRGAFALAMMILAGCTGEPLQRYAKSGDMLLVPFASIKRDAQMRYIGPADLTATITDQQGVTHPVKVFSTFRSFSDNTRFIDSAPRENPLSHAFAHYDGQWIAVLRLVNPADDQPLSLAAGEAQVSIASPTNKLRSTEDGINSPSLASLPVEILPGQSADASMIYNNFPFYLLPMPQVEVTPETIPAGIDSLGGGNFQFVFAKADFTDGDGVLKLPRAEKMTPDPNVQLLSSFKDEGENMRWSLIVMNPFGFHRRADYFPVVQTDEESPHPSESQPGASEFADLGIVIVLTDNGDIPVSMKQSWSEAIHPQPAESYYFNTQGQKLAEVLPHYDQVVPFAATQQQ